MNESLQDKKVVIMGLGLHGGGLASALYCAKKGAKLLITDLRDEKTLSPSMNKLKDWPAEYILGEHRIKDFEDADMVIKNPGVRADSPFLLSAKRVETDISLFLAQVKNPILAVTGSKGKSSTVSALHAILKRVWPNAKLGGNITVSPLTFLEDLKDDPHSPIVLELSSWQLADLRGRNLLKPRVSVITNIMNDHLNAYGSLEAYVEDKREIYRGQDDHDWTLVNLDDPYGESFLSQSKARIAGLSLEEHRPPHPGTEAWITLSGKEGLIAWEGKKISLLPEKLQIPGKAFLQNCLTAGAMAALFGVAGPVIREALGDFIGIPHRMEKFLTWKGIDFYNDTAATIPEAACASYMALEGKVRWLTGGTDKNLDLESYRMLTKQPSKLVLLGGSATQRLIPILQEKAWIFEGPFTTIKEAVEELLRDIQSNEAVILSPGAASFELFKNEFDRGDQFKAQVRSQTGN